MKKSRRKFIKGMSATALGLGFHNTLGSQNFPQQSLIVDPNYQKKNSLHEPTKYLFITDVMSSYLSVYDIESTQRVAHINLNFRPDTIEMARDDSILALGNREINGLVLLDLKTREFRTVSMPSPVHQLFFIPQTKLIAVGLRDQVGYVDYSNDEVHIFSRKFDSKIRDNSQFTYYKLLFSSFSQTYWVLDREKPLIYMKNGLDASDWKILDLSKRLSKPAGLDKGIASPEDFMLAFNTLEGDEGLIYFPHEDRLLSTGPMYTVGTTWRPLVMPYIDQYSQRVIFADMSGHVAYFDLREKDQKPHKFDLPFSPRIIRSGWLESTWIVGGDKALHFQSYDDPMDNVTYEFPYQVVDMWVTGDSKTLLLTVDEGPPEIWRFDIRTRQMLDPITVRGVVMANQIRMGSNNSICY
ncbi:hypothetical protein CA943_07425 [Taylorella equigenitalis]|uniref:YncE family protein n=1 Tax=Taylorella equigenitalis TaxID=29575 RepID=UPI000BACDB51|nr:hypothetical protein [Taylorella equigenitalis]ASY42909.1 hypothetical protein CA943_07425 [Taylorella equigenitalis]